MTYKDGYIYKGEWKKNNKTGLGIYMFKIGRRQIGYFKNGKLEGDGIDVISNNNVKEDRFENDELKEKD